MLRWLLVFSIALAGCAHGARGASARGFDARLTGYDYPFEVRMLPLRVQGQQLEMAYMDVRPEGAERTVLLLHGKNFSGAYWKSTIEALRDAGFRVVVPDQIGFGKSSKPSHFQYSLHQLAANTGALLDALGVERFDVVGHSMGGMVATRVALMYPDRVARLVLVNPIGLEDWKRHVPWRSVDELYEDELKSTPASVRAYFQRAYFDGHWKPEWEPLVEMHAGWMEGPDWELIAWNNALTFDMIFTQPVLYEFPDVRAETLLVIGQRDRTALGAAWATPEARARLGDYPALGKRTAKAIPQAKLVEFEGIGHIPMVEDFEAWKRALLDFLGG